MPEETTKTDLNIVLRDGSIIGTQTVTMQNTSYGEFTRTGYVYRVNVNPLQPGVGVIVNEILIPGYRLKPLTP